MNENISIRSIFRLMAVFAMILCFFIEALWLRIWNHDQASRSAGLAKKIQRYSKAVLWILNIEVRSQGDVPVLMTDVRGLIVSNHISYLDVLAISSQVPALFVTSAEVKESGWVGMLCDWAGCFFVERRKKTSVTADASAIVAALQSKVPLVIFPEGTSTVGTDVLPFKSSLFQSAIQAQCEISSICIRYEGGAQAFAYYDAVDLIPHLLSICNRRHSSIMTIHWLGVQNVRAEMDRKVLASASYEKIRGVYVS